MPGRARFLCSFIILFDCSISSRQASKPCACSSLGLIPQEGPSWGNPTGNILFWGHTDTVCTPRMLVLHLLLVLLILSAVLNRHLLLLGQYLPIPNLSGIVPHSLSLTHTLAKYSSGFPSWLPPTPAWCRVSQSNPQGQPLSGETSEGNFPDNQSLSNRISESHRIS